MVLKADFRALGVAFILVYNKDNKVENVAFTLRETSLRTLQLTNNLDKGIAS